MAGSGRGRTGRGGGVPFLKFTWTRVQTTLRGFPWRGSVSQSSPTRQDKVYRYGRRALRHGEKQKLYLHYAHTHPLTFVVFYRQLYQQQLQYIVIVDDFAVSAFSFPVSSVCLAICAESSHTNQLHTVINILHSPFKIVRSLFNHSIHIESAEPQRRSISCTSTSTVNWVWKNDMEDFFKANSCMS